MGTIPVVVCFLGPDDLNRLAQRQRKENGGESGIRIHSDIPATRDFESCGGIVLKLSVPEEVTKGREKAGWGAENRGISSSGCYSLHLDNNNAQR